MGFFKVFLMHGRGGGEYGFVWVVRVLLYVDIMLFRQVLLSFQGSRFLVYYLAVWICRGVAVPDMGLGYLHYKICVFCRLRCDRECVHMGRGFMSAMSVCP